MKIQSFEERFQTIRTISPSHLAVAVAQDRDVLHSVDSAY